MEDLLPYKYSLLEHTDFLNFLAFQFHVLPQLEMVTYIQCAPELTGCICLISKEDN